MNEIKIINPRHARVYYLVDHARENWNKIFDELETLSDRLEQLGIDEIMGADNAI